MLCSPVPVAEIRRESGTSSGASGPEREDDRRIISGIPHVLTSGCRWRDCPSEYGPRTTVYNRFNRWSRRGFWKAMLSAVAKAGWVREAAAIDATYVKEHRSAQGGKRGATAQAIGRSRGGQTTKIHALIDMLGRRGVLLLTPGNASDVRTAPDMLAGPPAASADKGYEADWLRADCGRRASRPPSPAPAPESAGSTTTSVATASAGASRRPSAA